MRQRINGPRRGLPTQARCSLTHSDRQPPLNQISLDQALKRIRITDLEIEHEPAFQHFDRIPKEAYVTEFLKAFQVGILALEQERISSFLARTQDQLGVELETLKGRLDAETRYYSQTAVKGRDAEDGILAHLKRFARTAEFSDEFEPTGDSAGAIPGNKTGDIICHIAGDQTRRIAIEVKFDKQVALGELEDRNWFTSGKKDTALSQLLEAKLNREAHETIIVFDKSAVAPAILKAVQDLEFHPNFGFIVIIDSLRGDYANLEIAYRIARRFALSDQVAQMNQALLRSLLQKLIDESRKLVEIEKLARDAIKKVQEIVTVSHRGREALDFCNSYLERFLETGRMSTEDLLEFYSGHSLKEKDKGIGKLIAGLAGPQGNDATESDALDE